MRALKKERERALVDLLGSTIISDFRDITGEFTPLNTRLDYLPEKKRDAVTDLEIRYRDAEQEVYFKAHGLSLPEDEKQRAELKQKMKAELASILSPEELRQYDLKTSDVAWKVRNEIEFFPVGDAEFSKLYDYRVALERLKDEGRSPSAFQEAKNELDQRLKSQLGENGYAQYLRSQDPGYRSAFQIAQRLELPASTADQVFELKARFELEKSAMISRANENTPAARQALKNDAETKLTELLGQEGFRIYKPRAGNWLDGLAP